MPKPQARSEDEWRASLTPEQFSILREGATEAPFSGTYVDEKKPGIYRCAGCGEALFSSEHKFDSGSGWPSYDRPFDTAHVELREDVSHGMRRTEVRCATCKGHLGHVFDDGPPTTGARYCINSTCLTLDPDSA